MPKFSVIPVEQAQQPPANNKRALVLKEYQNFIEQVGPRRAGSLTPDAGETPAAVRSRLGEAAKALRVNLTIRKVGETVYFWKVPRRGRSRRT